MDNDAIRSKLLDKFRDISRERLQKLNKGLLTLEKDPGNTAVVTEVMREIHTVKGESRMMDFPAVSTLAHSVEDLLKALKDKDFRMRGGTMDLLFQALDAVGTLIESGIEGTAPGVDVDSIVTRLSSEAEGVKKRGEGETRSRAEGKKWAVAPDGQAIQDKTEIVRVRAEELDTLASLVGDLFLSHSRSRVFLRDIAGIQDLVDRVDDVRLSEVGEIKGNLSRLQTMVKDNTMEMRTTLERLEDQVRQVRLLPFSTIFDPFPRAVRDLAREHGKEIEIEVSGGETLADKHLLEEIQTPLVHLIRNSVDHGIEPPAERKKKGKLLPGTIRLSAFHKGDRVNLVIADDGRGIEPEAVKKAAVAKGVVTEEEAGEMTDDKAVDLIFRSGFSTKETATETSGRGLGLDVVQEKVKGVGGSLIVESIPGKGTRFVLSLPVSLSLMMALLVRDGGETFAVQANFVETAVKLAQEDIQSVEGMDTIRIRDKTVPVVPLRELLGGTGRGGRPAANGRRRPVVVLRNGDQFLGCAVDEIGGEKEILLKPLGQYLASLRNVSGATVAENGQVILVLHVPDLFSAFKEVVRGGRKTASSRPEALGGKKAVLLVEDSLIAREMEKGLLESGGYEVVEAVDGVDAVEKLTARSYDLVLTDLQMPNMDGFELTRKIRADARWKGIPVVVVTTMASPEDRKRGLDAGADAYITKAEFTRKNLLDTIRRLIH